LTSKVHTREFGDRLVQFAGQNPKTGRAAVYLQVNQEICARLRFHRALHRRDQCDVVHKWSDVETDNLLRLTGEKSSQQIDPIAHAGRAQLARLANAGNAEMAAALAAQRARDLDRAVSISVGLDHRHQFRAAAGRFDRPVVSAQRSQVDLGHGRRPVHDFHLRLKPPL
jgi:hypothetical protein